MAEPAEAEVEAARDEGKEEQRRLMESLPATERTSSTL